MKLGRKIWLAYFVLLIFALNISESHSQSGVTLYPSQGTVFSDITLKAFVPINSQNNVYWDDSVIAVYVPVGQEHLPLTMQIKPPNQHPYSDLGNHTITVESFYWSGDYYVMYMNATFEITEYSPCDEWLALNITYHELLTNYTKLLNNHNSLVANYSNLNDDFVSLSTNYNSLFGNYDNLEGLYNSFLANYTMLRSDYDSLSANYDSLKSNSGKLATSYVTLADELGSVRNLNYIFIATTMIFIATSVYLVARRQK